MLRRSRAMARTMGRTAVIAGTATAVSGHVAHRQQARQGQQMAAPQPAPAPAPARIRSRKRLTLSSSSSGSPSSGTRASSLKRSLPPRKPNSSTCERTSSTGTGAR